jgi:hypothetical protein
VTANPDRHADLDVVTPYVCRRELDPHLGRGLGAGLLRHAMELTVAASDTIGVRMLVVTAAPGGRWVLRAVRAEAVADEPARPDDHGCGHPGVEVNDRRSPVGRNVDLVPAAAYAGLGRSSGADGNRTHDPLLAKQVL